MTTVCAASGRVLNMLIASARRVMVFMGFGLGSFFAPVRVHGGIAYPFSTGCLTGFPDAESVVFP